MGFVVSTIVEVCRDKITVDDWTDELVITVGNAFSKRLTLLCVWLKLTKLQDLNEYKVFY